jgi:hypothetical protein
LLSPLALIPKKLKISILSPGDISINREGS